MFSMTVFSTHFKRYSVTDTSNTSAFPREKCIWSIRLGNNHFDFFPLKRVFWEHHPINLKLGKDIYKYGKQRRHILDKHGYEHIPLIVSDIMFEDLPDICQKMSEHEIDFRKGKVPTDTGIYYLRDYETRFPEHRI